MNVCTLRLRRAACPLALGAAALALVILLRCTGAYVLLAGGTVRRLPVYSVERADKAIAITFDWAWGTERTDAILQACAREGVRATFFMVEFWAEKYPDYVRKIDGAGHEIGTHSATHSHMAGMAEERIRAELRAPSGAIPAVTGKEVKLFRAPFGEYDDRLIRTAEEEGYTVIQWDVDSLDWKDLSASEIALRVTSRVQPGSIILCHNNGLHTAEALPAILDALQTGGYTFVPVGELLLQGETTVDARGRQRPAS